MRISSRTTLAVTVCIFLAPLASCGPRSYSAKAIDATVVDADSAAPIAEAVVMAHWPLSTGSLAGGPRQRGQIAILEATTDKGGHFHLPAWGPRNAGGPDDGFYGGDSPEIFIFKGGYEYWIGHDEPPPHESYDFSSLQDSDWNGKAIPLKKFKGDVQEYAEHLDYVARVIGDMIGHPANGCMWEQIPLMLGALYRQDAEFRKQGVTKFHSPHWSLAGNDVDEYYRRKGCSSSKAFLERIQK